MLEPPVLRVVLVDDEAPARDEIQYLLAELPDIIICGQADNGKSALDIIREIKPDVIFLDIQMYDLNGFTVAEMLLRMENPPLIIFITAYEEYAVRAFEVNAIDYVLKPFSRKRLYDSVDKVRTIIANNEKVDFLKRVTSLIEAKSNLSKENLLVPSCNKYFKFTVERDGKIFPLDTDEIYFAYVENKETKLVTQKGEFFVNRSLQSLEEEFADKGFFRTHKACVVNLDQIDEIIPWFNCTFKLVMKDTNKTKVPVSRTYGKELKKLFNL
ncbi:LytTR family DNA-binding domain-containing protein [Metallumcola ferriviriculae]|uniref:Stage 0 sporulation protein A homolog n=1 Tax=Metallumcola ferriviriculae TaxID=3039180 RepID=A0AAU0UI72_9FIRM|nr:LytTR family DNA-binding domain-containing protein [Desulfitibacteraceae bacterium MK1]